ncbi:MAG: P1 family peptidase [Gemmatimonadota bacterium]
MAAQTTGPARPRAREAGLIVGVLPTGPLNAITDVAGVRVGQVTVIEGDSVRTGVTAIIQHEGDVFKERVPAAIYVGNGYGKLLGVSQVRELGELETPILLTCTLCVWRAADAMIEWLLKRPGMESIRSINAVVGETNDGYLNDIRQRPIRPEHVVRALESASSGPVSEGSVGAGTGTGAFGWKGGIGTSSRKLPASLGGYTVGALVQTNYGGILTINGAPVGRELGQYAYRKELERTDKPGPGDSGDGSCMMVIATDAPLDWRSLERLAKRAIGAMARSGSTMYNGSGDYVIAFSTAASVRRRMDQPTSEPSAGLSNDAVSPVFLAGAEATEEAIYNSMFRATTVKGVGGNTLEALPLDKTLAILRKYNALKWNETLRPR